MTEIEPVAPIQRLSDAMAAPLLKVYRAGGYGLTLLWLGAVFLMAANLVAGTFGKVVLSTVGAHAIAVPGYLFYVKEIRPVGLARQAVEGNRELIDEMQDVALSMSQIGLTMQALIYKHAASVDALLTTSRGQLRAIPIPAVKALAERPAISNAHSFATAVLATSERLESVLSALNEAITTSDATRLRQQLRDLETVRTELRQLLALAPAVDPAAEPAPGYRSEPEVT
jgi:hypothetical protein